eukprot:TRINITY_DN15815_c0_g1_i1.p2 TRINITY_DN15815_c0_g1~~TRINITY_DN15815_c0_g1_i1.p2  ORF type:complete len:116 (-),score=22.23 TRINITY_DN15815_c0_g1_i1:173-520(-)
MAYIPRGGSVRPPQKGSFPLDHFKECTDIFHRYMKCLKEHQQDNRSCRLISQEYLKCRMDKGLMAPEEMSKLGFDGNEGSTELTEEEKRLKEISEKKMKEGFVAGLGLVGRKRAS